MSSLTMPTCPLLPLKNKRASFFVFFFFYSRDEKKIICFYGRFIYPIIIDQYSPVLPIIAYVFTS